MINYVILHLCYFNYFLIFVAFISFLFLFITQDGPSYRNRYICELVFAKTLFLSFFLSSRRRRRRPTRPRLPGQSFAIEHRVRAKMTKFRPLLGAAVDDSIRAIRAGSIGTARPGGGSLLGVPTVHLLFPDITFPRPLVRALRET